MIQSFSNIEKCIMVIFIIIGVTSIIGGFIYGKSHCFVLGAVASLVPCVWYIEDYKRKGKSLWQNKNTTH